jgi:hypothetical protein
LAFEAADRFASAFAFCLFAFGVGARGRVVAGLRDRDAVEAGVQLRLPPRSDDEIGNAARGRRHDVNMSFDLHHDRKGFLDRVPGVDRAGRAPDYRAALTVVRMTVWFLPLDRT